MGRPRGSGVRAGLPVCGLHPGSHVVRNGRYGKPPRQLWKCEPADGTKAHSFTEALPRFVAAAGHTCPSCEVALEPHQGGQTPATYEYAVREAAAALVAVGNGVSYTEAATIARVRSGRPGGGVPSAQLACNWVEVATPIVAAPFVEPVWPETIVCDSTNFLVTDSWTKVRSQAFAVLAVWGYDPGRVRGRLVALRASHRAGHDDWYRLFSLLGGTPRLIVADLDTAIHRAAVKRWPAPDAAARNWSPVPCEPFVKWCEHHLYKLALSHMRHYGLTGDPAKMALLAKAFKSPQGWAAFRRMAAAYLQLDDWCARNDHWVRPQASWRARLPAHHANGAVEHVLSRTRDVIGARAFTLRNEYRTNQMLELVRLRLNRHADETTYASALRDHLAAGGRFDRQLACRDIGTKTGVTASLR